MSANCFVSYPEKFGPHSSRAYGLRRAGLAASVISASDPDRAEEIAKLISGDQDFKGAVANEWLAGFRTLSANFPSEKLNGTLNDTSRALDQRVLCQLECPPSDKQGMLDVLNLLLAECGKKHPFTYGFSHMVQMIHKHSCFFKVECWTRTILEGEPSLSVLSYWKETLHSLHTTGEAKVRARDVIDMACKSFSKSADHAWMTNSYMRDWIDELGAVSVTRIPHLLAEPRTYKSLNPESSAL